jgi:hypothetical protein
MCLYGSSYKDEKTRFNRRWNHKGEYMPTEVTMILTILGVFIANASLVIPLFLWVRTEARADERHTDAKLESTRELVRAIYEESKDFHARLCAIEERNKK